MKRLLIAVLVAVTFNASADKAPEVSMYGRCAGWADVAGLETHYTTFVRAWTFSYNRANPKVNKFEMGLSFGYELGFADAVTDDAHKTFSLMCIKRVDMAKALENECLKGNKGKP